MFKCIRRFWQRATQKNTTSIQFESVRTFMKHMGYPKYQGGRFFGAGVSGCAVISYKTAVRLHNTKIWNIEIGANNTTVHPAFNKHLKVNADIHLNALNHKIVANVKQQLVEKYGESTIKTQSHIVRFCHRGCAKAWGLV